MTRQSAITYEHVINWLRNCRTETPSKDEILKLLQDYYVEGYEAGYDDGWIEGHECVCASCDEEKES